MSRLAVVACLSMQVGIVSPDDQQFAQVLDRRTFELAADSRKQRVAFAAHIAEHADLDQLMRFERDIDFAQHGGRQSVRTDRDYGVQVVRLGTQRAALFGGHGVHTRSLPCAVGILCPPAASGVLPTRERSIRLDLA